ncbi:MAG: beta galactosidase jelly roll domain-containing protein [Cyclobacteriaceae bacterium]
MKLVFNVILLLVASTTISQDLDRVIDLRGDWKFNIGDNPRWAGADFDDSDWEELFVPSRWEDEGFSGFDGYAWYRKEFELRNEGNNLILVLGYIDDADEVYFNGELIGFSGGFPPKFHTAYDAYREYPIPNHLINQNGRNTVAVRVYDTVLDGGIIKGRVGIYENPQITQDALVLEGVWKIKVGDEPHWRKPEFDDHKWQTTIVPNYLRDVKMGYFDDVVWFRKEFVVPENYTNEKTLVLILGKIDDFDRTYLNGELIGETNDGGIFGTSNSYIEDRVYPIPPDLINRNGKNVISVRVKDIGKDVGIHQGPIGIVPFAQYRNFLKSRD